MCCRLRDLSAKGPPELLTPFGDKREKFTPRTDDLYDLFPIYDLDISGEMRTFLISTRYKYDLVHAAGMGAI